MTTDVDFNWSRFHAYRVFDEFLETFILSRKSYITRHEQELDLEKVFTEIHDRFSDGFDNSQESFEKKIRIQFEGASENCKIVFANVEFLWAMPVGNISSKTKKSYALRWFGNESEVNNGEKYFFGYPHTIANFGPWYLMNKYWELIALLRIMSLIASDSQVVDLASAKRKIAELSYSAIYEGIEKEERFAVTKVCGVHSALMHLSAPNQFESIISENHKEQISKVFKHVISDTDIVCREEIIRLIRERLFDDYGDEGDPDRKHRWFFYLSKLEPLWIDKKSVSQQLNASIDDEVNREQAALGYSEEEGHKENVNTYRVYRSAKLVKRVKKRDNFTCRACKFTFRKQIVHVHHLDPLSERKSPKETTPDDLVTLCPNCHYQAHFWLRNDDKFKKLGELLPRLQNKRH